jgi:hypothetical protein
MFNLNYAIPKLNSIEKQTGDINIHYDNLLNVEGNIDKSIDVASIVKTAIDKNNSTLITLIKQNK